MIPEQVVESSLIPILSPCQTKANRDLGKLTVQARQPEQAETCPVREIQLAHMMAEPTYQLNDYMHSFVDLNNFQDLPSDLKDFQFSNQGDMLLPAFYTAGESSQEYLALSGHQSTGQDVNLGADHHHQFQYPAPEHAFYPGMADMCSASSPPSQTSCSPAPAAVEAREPSPPVFIELEGGMPQSPGQWETGDYSLAVATLQAEAEGSQTPLVKEELRYRIQRKRKASGLDELQVEYNEEGPEQLTPRDIEKKARRREQNRLAAQRCRKKKREESKIVVQGFQEMECLNTKLQCEIKVLQKEKTRLEQILQSHLAVCAKRLKFGPPPQP